MQNSPARSGIDVGSVIADTYTIEALIGRGGMGAVFLASHRRLPGKQVAIKVLHAELAGDEVLARFKREAEIASRLGHPNIVAVHDFNVMSDGTPYLVLEYLHGESLAQRLRHGPLPVDQAMSIVRQIGSALAAAHREGIVHRDLKPQNIFIVPTEVDGRVVEIAKVLDFGISKIRGSTTVKTQDSALLGTPQYMAPEQATGQHSAVDARTDIFAFGAIVYEMLSGQPAFSGETIPEVVFKVVYEQPMPLAERAKAHGATVPDGIAAAVHRAMAKDAADRFASVGEFVEALTGHALPVARAGASIPPPDVGFASGSRIPNTGNDAFAQTMGSGDHGAAATAETRDVPPQAPVGRTGASATELGNAGTVSAHPPPAKKRTGILVAGTFGAAAIAAGVIYLVTRTPPQPPPQAAVVHDAAIANVEVAPDAVVETTAEIDVPPPKPDTQKPDTQKPDTPKPDTQKPDTPKPDKPKPDKPKPPPDDDDDGGDETVKQKLGEAQAALDAGNYDRAQKLASTVANSEDANPRQKMRAFMIDGIVQCVARNDEGRARAQLRKLALAPAMRRKLLDACHQHGWLRNVR